MVAAQIYRPSNDFLTAYLLRKEQQHFCSYAHISVHAEKATTSNCVLSLSLKLTFPAIMVQVSLLYHALLLLVYICCHIVLMIPIIPIDVLLNAATHNPIHLSQNWFGVGDQTRPHATRLKLHSCLALCVL